jgi:type IV pilus assembly protein PilM
MARRVTLYIEDTEVKLLVTSGSKVEKWGSLMLEEGLVDQGIIQDQKKVSEAIQRLFKLQSVSQRTVTVGLSGLNSVFRIISLPEVPKNMLPEAVSNEASRVLPMPLSQVYHAYQILPSAKGEIKLFLAAYPREATDTLIDTVQKAGLKPAVLDLASLALARTVNAPRAIIVNAWLTFLDIVVLSDRLPQVIRSLSLPVESGSLRDRLPTILEELSRTVTFYNSSNPDKILDKSVPVLVCGDLAREEQGWQSLGQLGFPVSTVQPPVDAKPAFDPTQFTVNIGLALKGILPGNAASNYSLIDFNALPAGYKPPAFSWARVLVPVGVAVALVALGYGWLLVRDFRQHVDTLKADYAGLQAETSRIRTENQRGKANLTAGQQAVSALLAQQASVQSQIDAQKSTAEFFNGLMSDLQKGLGTANAELREVVTKVPNGVILLDASYDAETVTLTGQAREQALILGYGRVLVASGRFSSVTLTSLQAAELGDGSAGLKFVYLLR